VDAVLLELLHPAVERDGVEPAGEDDASATRAGLRLVPVDHLSYPGWFTAQVDVAGSGGDARLDECRSIQLVGTNRGDNDSGALGHRSQAGGIVGIGDNERHLGRYADERTNLLELVSIAPCYCPAETAIISVPLSEVLGHEPSREARGAVDDNVQITGHKHAAPPPSTMWIRQQSEQVRRVARHIPPQVPRLMWRLRDRLSTCSTRSSRPTLTRNTCSRGWGTAAGLDARAPRRT
jgi:hypothetical protein